jgi:poly(3-hydroxyalkanoate) synthetase
MAERGYLEGKKMATAFNMLRSNDLIWPYVISNYLKGKQPYPFDLLYWNSDSTRMPAANHSFYLRNCYLENKLSKGLMVIDNVRLDLGRSPFRSTISRRARTTSRRRSRLPRLEILRRAGEVRARGSGHIAGVVNPPARSRSTSTGPATIRSAASTSGSRRRPSIPARGGPTGSSGSSFRTARPSRRVSPAAARTSRSRTRRAVM